jgi:hypothetical protein
MDRGAALNCRVVHNWKAEKPAAKKQTDKAAKDTSKPDIALSGEAGVTESAPESDLLQSSELPQHASEANNVADDAALKMLAESAPAEVTPKKQPASGRRLGIFGFGSRAAKLPDASS